MNAVEMIERSGTFSDIEAALHGHGDIGFRQRHGFAQTAASSEMSCDRRSKRAAGAVGVAQLHQITAEDYRLGAVKEHVHGSFHVPALDDGGLRAARHQLTSGSFHSRNVFDLD